MSPDRQPAALDQTPEKEVRYLRPFLLGRLGAVVLASRIAFAILGFALLPIRLGLAATFTWTGSGGNVDWSTAGNWTGGAPASAATTDLIFSGTSNTGSASVPLNQNIAVPMLLNSLSFNSGAGSFYLNGGALRFAGANNTISQNSSGDQFIGNDLVSPSGNSTTTITLTGNGSGVVTLSGTIAAGAGQRDIAIVKSGSGTFSLTGNNTYSGGTTINGGTLIVNSATSLGATGGGLTINAGTLEVATGFSTNRAITLGNAASTFQIDNAQTYTVTSVINGAGTLNKTGTGTMILSAANTFNGGTHVTAGTLRISAADRLLNTGALTVSGGTFDLQTFSENVGAVTLASGSITGTGAGTLIGTSYTLQSGIVTGILAGTATLAKTTAGTVTLSGANTYTGTNTISGGTLSVSTNANLGNVANR
ncbi:MAG: fibronectin-binding autotransporter adhesin [Chthoniobacter sp.]|jgi:autotransporter-associated beta strand protein|nr:fibronectin-binding autotransporter adhesin [Chthoniobacter sp.]